MDIKIIQKEKELRIEIGGVVDELGAEDMERVFRETAVQSSQKVILDFRKMDYIGSAGVGSLLLLYKRIAPGNGEIIIENIPKSIYRLLAKDMNLEHVFTMKSM